jgi:Mg2+ and Co2+ transporter CorA
VRAHAFRPGDDDFATAEIHCLVSDTWVATLHCADIDLIEVFNQPIAPSSDIGRLDGPAFLAHLVDWQLRGFFRADEQLDERIDWIDDQLLGTDDEDDDHLLDELIELRRVTGRLRRTITPHRDVLAVLAQPELAGVSDSTSAKRFARLANRLERVIDAIEDTRQMVTDSLDILMTKAAQRTNDTMKILTVVSILLLPAVVVAGIMGMNFQLGFFQRPDNFWIVLAAMALLATTTALVARLRNWL